MEKILNRQWMALPVACAQVPELLPSAATPAAHARVGYGAVVPGTAPGAALVRLAKRPVQVQGTSVFAVKTSVIEMDPVGGVRGIPPRGWPV